MYETAMESRSKYDISFGIVASQHMHRYQLTAVTMQMLAQTSDWAVATTHKLCRPCTRDSKIHLKIGGTLHATAFHHNAVKGVAMAFLLLPLVVSMEDTPLCLNAITHMPPHGQGAELFYHMAKVLNSSITLAFVLMCLPMCLSV